jgi:hypothetical protein
MSSDNLHFRFVIGGPYKRKIQPHYPSKSAYTVNGAFDEHRYYLMVRAIIWETAHKDIEQQKPKSAGARQFKITGISYDRNRSNNNFFLEDTPPEIKALAKNLYDRTNPLWDKAMQYVNKPEFVYKIKQVYIILRLVLGAR